MIDGLVPADLLALEKIYIYDVKATDTMDIWQQGWDENLEGKWTQSLIRDLTPWLQRKHGEVDYYLIQFLTG